MCGRDTGCTDINEDNERQREIGRYLKSQEKVQNSTDYDELVYAVAA